MNSLRRVNILLYRELARGPLSLIFIFVIVIPFAITLLISLLFGTLFSGKPRLGFADAGRSRIVTMAEKMGSFVVQEYDTAAALKEAVGNGVVDMGVVLPADFDEAVRSGTETEISAYIWGESLLRNRAIVGFAFARLIRDVAGQEAPVNIVTRTLRDEDFVSWEDRILPLIVLMMIILGGSMIPATSLVDEKQKRTLNALNITPASLGEVFAAKALMGIIVSSVMAVVVLLLNRAFGGQPALLIFVLLLGAVSASLFGILLGAFVKDINTLFAVFKGIGILLYAPAIIALFPTIPQWIAKIFPTYYIVQPVIEIVQQGATLADVAPKLFVLGLIILVQVGIIAYVIRRAHQYETVVIA
ncbi:MAG: ABC transporter permease [Chloroflexi bacterium]|nr:ABC transporter permease [Chloroflexota bacterium]